MNKVSIDIEQINKICESLKNIGIRDSHRNRSFITFKASKEKKMLAYLLCSAICHQTHNLKNIDKNLIGWNYLEYVFEKLATENSNLLDVVYLHDKNNNELQAEIENLFPIGETNSKSSLDKIEERVCFIKNAVNTIVCAGYKSIYEYLKKCNGYLYNNETGFYLMEYNNHIIGYLSTETWEYKEKIDEKCFSLGHSIKETHIPNGNELYISSMGILPNFRGKGLGKILFKEVTRCITEKNKNIKSEILIVSEKWDRAIKIYEENKFCKIIKIKDFFAHKNDHKENGIVMRKYI